jgi:hypothetical protein
MSAGLISPEPLTSSGAAPMIPRAFVSQWSLPDRRSVRAAQQVSRWHCGQSELNDDGAFVAASWASVSQGCRCVRIPEVRRQHRRDPAQFLGLERHR